MAPWGLWGAGRLLQHHSGHGIAEMGKWGEGKELGPSPGHSPSRQTAGGFPCLAPGVAFVPSFEAVTGIMIFNGPAALLLPYLVVTPKPIIS